MAAAHSPRIKTPPCDQCRRRKIRCDTAAPKCDRCIQSGLRCTSDIVRRRRGPKKGSGSVIARLKDEEGQAVLHDHSSTTRDLVPLDATREHSGLPASVSAESIHLSPRASSSRDPIGLTSDLDASGLPTIPHSQAQHVVALAPAPLPTEAVPGTNTTHTETPLSWRIADSQTLAQCQTHSSGLVTVNQLAHQIFNSNKFAPMTYDRDGTDKLSDPLSLNPTPPIRPTSIDAILSSATTAPSLSASTYSPPSLPYNEGPLLYRINSGPIQLEPRVAALADEVNMSAKLMSQCMKQYFRHIYPIMPVIHESTFRRRLNRPDDLQPEERCLLLSLCAITVLHAAPPSGLDLDAKKDLGRKFVSHFLDVRKNSDWVETASLTSIISSLFVATSFFELKQPRTHHFYLREATGMAIEQGLHLDSFYTNMGHMQAICHRRTFALLFVTERGCAILRNKPISIARLPALPHDPFDDEDPSIIAGFQCLCRMFMLLDENFVELWRDSSSQSASLRRPLENIASIQNGLSIMDFETSGLTDIQMADVSITQQWLRLIFWQASMRHGLVSSSADHVAFSYDFPITIAKKLCEMMDKVPMGAVLVHGLGIVRLSLVIMFLRLLIIS